MPATTVFKCDDYKEFLRHQIDENRHLRGYQTQLARAARCQKSHLSQVLNADRNLSSEQAMRLAKYWNLQDAEVSYFIGLVDMAHTSFPPLQRLIKRRLVELKAEHEDLSRRLVKYHGAKAVADPSLYYSSWHYVALHILAGIETYATADSMASRLQLPLDLVNAALSSLAAMGIIAAANGTWSVKTPSVHLAKGAPWEPLHHMNWRHRAIIDAQRRSDVGLHYTAVQSHSEAEFAVIRAVFTEALEKVRAIVGPSRNEEASCICLDFFSVR